MTWARMKSAVRKYYKVVLLLLILSSLLIDIFRIQGRPLDLQGGQTQSWWEIAYNVEHGFGYKACNESYVPNCELTEQYTAIREPLPILLFALAGKFSKDSPTALLSLVICFYFLISIGIFLLGKELGNIDVALLSLLFWTFYLPQERIEASLTGDLVSGAFVILGYFAFTRAVKQNKLRDWILVGFVMGLAVLSRSAMLVVAITLIVGHVLLSVYRRFKVRDIMLKGTLALVVLGLVLSPWVVRNYLVFGQPVIGTTLVGYNLYRHNYIVAKDVPPHYVGPDEAWTQVQELVARRPELQTPINEAQVDAVFRDEAVQLILAHPLSYVRLSLYRIIPLWFNVGVREQYNEQMSVSDYLTVLQQIVLLIAFVLGLRLKNDQLRLFGLSILVYCFSYLAIDSQLRYLVPLMPIVIVIGAIGIIEYGKAILLRKSVMKI